MALTRIKSSDVVVTPTGNVAATNAQSAIAEIDSEKQVSLVSGTNIKTVGGVSILGSGDIAAGSGSGGQVITGNVTLSSSSGAAISVTPSSPGLYATLPDATTCPKSDNTFAIYNAGDYDYGVKDSAGTQLGWVRPRTGSLIGLADNTTAVGVWSPYGLEKIGVTAEYTNLTQSVETSTLVRVVVDTNRTLFVFGGVSGLYAVVYDASTVSWGNAALIKSSLSGDYSFTATLSATDQVLVVYSYTPTTDLSAVTLSLTGTSITVNTPVQATMASPVYGIYQLTAVGSSFVALVSMGSSYNLVAFVVSGTVPTIGANTTLGIGNSPPTMYVSGSIVRTLTADATTLYCKPFTVSGTTLTAGTSATTTVDLNHFKSYVNASGNIVVVYTNSSLLYVAIVKLTGTTEAISSVNTTGISSNSPYYYGVFAVTGNKTFVVCTSTATSYVTVIVTDTSGTASVGSLTTVSNGGSNANSAPQLIYKTGTTLTVNLNSSTAIRSVSFDCSGAAPSVSNSVVISYSTTGLPLIALPNQSDAFCVRPANMLSTPTSSHFIGAGAAIWDSVFSSKKISRTIPLVLPMLVASGIPSTNSNESWFHGSINGSVGRVIIKVEAA